MKIAFVASEVYPFIKTGGLADVAFALPKALKKIGHDVRVFLPKYKQIKSNHLKHIKWVTDLELDGKWFTVESVELDGVTYYFINEPALFYRDSIYENDDRDYQFAFFSEAVLRLLGKIDFQADVVHCNDWQTGVIPFMLLQRYGQYDFYRNMKTVYTIHNLRFQGEFSSHNLRHLGFDYQDEEVNFMKLGITHATYVNTVSPTYAQEILTDFYGERLNHLLRSRQDSLCGILNGIDETFFNPQTDSSLIATYSCDHLKHKEINKLALQRRYGLEINENIPMIGLVTRLDAQKGLDLISDVLREMLEEDKVQFFILGSGEQKFEAYFQQLRDEFPSKLGVHFGCDEKLAHLIYAASDLFLMPSLYEPCGLSQLIALRYGSVPIVRETGGLNDTVKSYNEYTREGNGFTFANYNAHDMMYTIRRSLYFYKNQPENFKHLIQNGMKGDYSWNQSAIAYENLYKKLI
ncbi:MAG: glycogen synthase [Turicibacter sp.]